MALKFKCQDCGADIIVNFLKAGENARCNSCENYSVVPETAVEVSEDAYNYYRKHGVARELSVSEKETITNGPRGDEEERNDSSRQTIMEYPNHEEVAAIDRHKIQTSPDSVKESGRKPQSVWLAIALVVGGIVLLVFAVLSFIGGFILTDPTESLGREGRSGGMVILSLMLIGGGLLVLSGVRSIAQRYKARDLQRKEETVDEEGIPAYRLYSPGQVGVITYIATPMAGSILLAASFGKLGKTTSVRRAVIWGGISTITLAVLAFFTPPNIPRVLVYLLPAVHTFIMNWIVNETYRKDYENHIARMGERGIRSLYSPDR